MKKDIKWIGKWDCDFCGTIGIDAIVMGSDGKPIRQLFCPNCGATVPKIGKHDGSPFYLPENPEVLNEKYSHAFGVPNWRCSSCDAENPDIKEVTRCLKCGNPKENTDFKRIKTQVGSNEKHIDKAIQFDSEEELVTENSNIIQSEEDANIFFDNVMSAKIENKNT